jgi:hypothetical protein
LHFSTKAMQGVKYGANGEETPPSPPEKLRTMERSMRSAAGMVRRSTAQRPASALLAAAANPLRLDRAIDDSASSMPVMRFCRAEIESPDAA